MLRWSLALVLGVCLVVPARAGPHDSWLKQFHEDASWGRGEVLLKQVRDPSFERIAKDPEALFNVCGSLCKFGRILTARSAEHIDEIHEIVLPYAQTRLSLRPLQADDVYAWACVVIAIERSLVARGRKPDLERWHDAVKLALEARELVPDREDVALDLVRWCGELATLRKSSTELCLENADRILSELLAAGNPNWRVVSAAGHFYEQKARAAVARGKKRDALVIIDEGLAFVEKYLDATPRMDDPRNFLPRARCNLITTARELKLKCKSCYRVEEMQTKGEFLTAKVPESGTWQTTPPNHELVVFLLAQFSPEGKSARSIKVRALGHGTLYDMDGAGEGVLADNAKMISERTRNGIMWTMQTVHEEGKVRKGRPAKSWPTGYHFTVVGTDSQGVWTRNTVVTTSSRKLDQTFQFVVTEWEDNDDGRCELEFVLASLRPPK